MTGALLRRKARRYAVTLAVTCDVTCDRFDQSRFSTAPNRFKPLVIAASRSIGGMINGVQKI